MSSENNCIDGRFCDAETQNDTVLNLVYYWPETISGSTAEAPCFTGSNETATRLCLINGFSEPDTVNCIDCGQLTPPMNGFLFLNGTSFESVAEYSCETGYDLIGEESRVCTNYSTWSGEDPICQSKAFSSKKNIG